MLRFSPFKDDNQIQSQTLKATSKMKTTSNTELLDSIKHICSFITPYTIILDIKRWLLSVTDEQEIPMINNNLQLRHLKHKPTFIS